ncbi:MAG: type IV toxin-antitoxin system AbiEi family antitoxin domain-containing protein [Acidimicrobiales bacterium]
MAVALRRRLDTWLSSHHGVVDAKTMRAMGHTSAQIRWLVRSGAMITMARGLYRSAAHAESELQLMVGACLIQPKAAVALISAGRLLGFREMTDPGVHILVPHGARLDLPGARVHRCRQIDPVDITGRRSDGIRLTSPPRTLFDSAAILGTDRTESVIEQALAERRCTLNTLMATAARLYHARRPGADVFVGVLDARPSWRRAVRSELERRVRQAIAAKGVPEPEVNMPYRLQNGRRIEIDLAWPEWRTAVEVDHRFWHDVPLQSVRDKRRDRKLAREGWQTVRFPEREIAECLDELVEDLAAILVERGWTAPAAPMGA